jgi:vitamin B12 transporter
MFCKVIILAGLALSGHEKPDRTESIMDTIAIEGVVVNTKLQRFNSSLSLKIIPTTELKQSKQLLLSDILGSISNISVNNLGPGGIALASLRGLGTYHTAVLWNGINLQNSMNGNVNLSSIPVSFIDNLAIQYGGNGALFGSGAIGGTINIDNSLDFGKGHSSEFYQTYGSFNSIYSGFNYTFSGANFASSTRMFYSEAKNDFRFHNTTKKDWPFENQENSNSSKLGLLQNLAYQITPDDNLSAIIWYQSSFNRYPPMMLSSTNHEHENTVFVRGVVQWRATRKNFDFNLKGGLIKDSQEYRNPGQNEASNHHSNLLVFEGESIFKISTSSRVETGINLNFEDVRTTNYSDVKQRFRPAFSAAYRFYSYEGKFEAFAGLREEMIGNYTTPLTWSIGSKVKLSDRFVLRANISKNYRVPTMNDLFWIGWGNPKLKPEAGYSEEIGVDFISRNESSSIIAKLNTFNNNVMNWIIWAPNGSGWTPNNMEKVWARGLDLSFSYTKNTQNWHWGFELMGTGTISTTEKSANPTEIGKQLVYIPKIKAGGSFLISYKSFWLKYSESYTGKRFTSAENTSHIEPYWIGAVSIEKTFEGKAFSLKTFVRADNIWNQEYQVMAWYPMPLRSYQIGVSILFNKPIH